MSHSGPVSALTRMRARRRDEAHRAATPLELFFDLCFVVAVAQAGAQLVEFVAEGDVGHGLIGYLFVFFAIWWAWVNFTWFASAYDCDDVPYRLATLVQITGALVMASGVPRAFGGDFTVAVIGYLIMRVALTLQWLRAARGESGALRKAALRYAGGLVLVQTAWVVLLLLPEQAWVWGFWPLAAAESAVLDELLPIAAGGLAIVFAAFWIYFAAPIHEYLRSDRQAFLWGYGHYFIFGSAAAIGAGIEVAVEEVTHHAHISTLAASFAVTAPAALFMVTVWLVHSRHFKRGAAEQLLLPIGAFLVLAATFAGHWAVPLAGLAAAATVATGVYLETRRNSGP